VAAVPEGSTEEPSEEAAVAEPTEEPTAPPEPTDAPDPAESVKGDAEYQHPSGLFAMTPFSDQVQEGENYTSFGREDTLVMGFAFPTPDGLTDLEPAEFFDTLLDLLLVQMGYADSFTAYPDDATEYGLGVLVWYEFSSSTLGEGEGELYLVSGDTDLAGMVLLSPDWAADEEDWYAGVDSFVPAFLMAEAPEGEEAEEGEEAAAEPAEGSADSGFRPEMHGFGFENYGGEPGITNLTAAEVHRMYGDRVCASMAGGECILTPQAEQWMKQINGYMDGGHCEGMAVLSNLMYFGQIDPADFGGTTAHDLDVEDEALQREIAYWFTTQGTYPGASVKVLDAPSEVVYALQEAFAAGQDASEWWAVGIYKRDGSGGHAVTPIAVEDLGDGLYNILVYDNNYPDAVRTIEVDTNAETWQYWASINPGVDAALYEGDAETDSLEIVAISPRLGEQECTFCLEGGMTGGGGEKNALLGQAEASEPYYEVWLEGAADLLIEDETGQRIGFVEGEFVNEIPGASGDSYKFLDVWEDDSEPIYQLPVSKLYSVTVDGSRLEDVESSAVTLLGPGFFLYIDDLALDPGEQDSMVFMTEEDLFALNYQTAYAESPAIVVGKETDEADYVFMLQATDIPGAEDSFYAFLDMTENAFVVDTSDNTEAITVDLFMFLIDETGEHVYGISDLTMDPGTQAFLMYLQAEEGSGAVLAVDYDGDGEPDDMIELEDVAGEIDWGEEEGE
ncbi:MAG TPA: hypothetical protein VLC52_13125, partial [Anaerolineae bacterium]|nr:hypothetical protein [Anaerolineae bacterium]